MTKTAATPLDRARAGWGDPPPDWVVALAEACQRERQSAVARRLGYSDAVISTVLRGTYRGDVGAVETKVRAALMATHVACPVLGDIELSRCLDEQARPFAATSGFRVRMYHACRACPNNRQRGGGQ
jgi:hypothetical protein